MISILNYDFKNLNFFHFLLLLLPLALVSGPFLADLIVTLISFYFCFIFFIKKKFKSIPIVNIFINFFLVFYAVAIISSIFAIEPTVSLKSSITYIRFLLFALGTYYLLKDNLFLINILSFIILILIFFLSIDVLFQYIFKYNLFGMQVYGSRPSSLFGEELILGSFIARLFPLGFIYIFSLHNQKKNILFIIYTIACLIAIIISQERTAFIHFILGHFLFFILIKDFRKIYIYILSLGAIFIFILLLNKSNIFDRLIKHTIDQSSKGNHVFLYSERHTDHILTAINMIKSKPIIGHGNKSFRFLCSKPQYSTEKITRNRSFYYSKYDQKVTILQSPKSFLSKDLNGQKIILINLSRDKKTYSLFSVERLFRPSEQGDIDQTTFDKQSLANSHQPYTYNIKKGDLILEFAMEHLNGCNTHPHHLFIQVFSENGLINFIIIIMLFFTIIYLLIKEHKNKDKDIINYNIKCVLLVIGLITLFPFVPSGNFFNNWLSVVYFFPLGLYFATLKKII